VAFKVRKGVAVLGENKELGPAVVQLGHLGPSQAVAQGDELALFASGHGGVRLGGQPPELDDLGAELFDGGGSRDLGGSALLGVLVGVVDVGLVVNGVEGPSSHLGQVLPPFAERQAFDLVRLVRKALGALSQRRADGAKT